MDEILVLLRLQRTRFTRHLSSCSLHVHEMLIMLRARRITICHVSPVDHPGLCCAGH